MRTASTVIGAGCLAIGVLLLVAGLGAAMGMVQLPQTTVAPAAQASTGAVGGLALDASVEVDLAGVKVARDVSLDPEQARAAKLPGLSAQRAERLAPDALPVSADLGVDLQMGSHLEREGEEGGSVAGQAAAVEPVATPRSLVLAAALVGAAGLLVLFASSIGGLAKKLLVLPIVGLYAKVARSEVFENQVRERIFEAIRTTPGIAATDLARHANVAWGTTIYHLDVLEQTSMVTSIREGRHRRYFLNGAPLDGTKQSVAILQNRVTAEVVERIRTAPGATQKELASATRMSPQALHWHLTRLVGAGLVRKEREGRVVRHFPSAS